ncbi:MAG: hypothetical protein ACP6IQ_08100 [Candidatus Njordarchaeia archaeon]
MALNIRKEIIRLLKEDEEFRYMVAGLIGIQEVLKRLDRIEEEQKALREDFNTLRKDFNTLREDFNTIREDFNSLREDFNSLREDFNSLREDFNKMLAVIGSINKRLTRIEKTVEKMTVDIEEEARAFVKHKLKEKGIDIKIDVLTLPEAEINIYGANENLCVIGEATIRAGLKILDEIEKKYELLKSKYPGYLREKVIRVLYVLIPLPEVAKEARKRKIWMLKATKDYVSLDEVL